MAQDYGDYLANYWLNYLRTSKTVYAAPSTTYPALDGSNVTEPGQSDYVRPSLAWNTAAARVMTTSALADFISGGGAASGSAGPFPHVAFYDAATSGNFLGRCTLTVPLAWVSGSQVEIAAGDISFRFPSS
jgi:hypothetical protein